MRGRKCWHTQYPGGMSQDRPVVVRFCILHTPSLSVMTMCHSGVNVIVTSLASLAWIILLIRSPSQVSANTSNDIFVSFSVLASATGEILSARRTPRLWLLSPFSWLYPSLWYARLGLNPSWCFLHSFHRQNFIRTVSNYQLHFSKYWDNHKTFPSWGGFLCEDITPNSVGILRRPKMISLFVIKIPVWPRVWRADNFKFNITIKMIVWRSSYSILEYSRAPIWRQ